MTRWARSVLLLAAFLMALSGVRGFNAIWGEVGPRLEDVGDRWRALLIGAPPSFL
ncbi:MAG TPA: hypothetical protein VFW57_03855 [Acidimicrobiia bacterium]|nr:hypothetical protein [Acidimicrobiia bacterium]